MVHIPTFVFCIWSISFEIFRPNQQNLSKAISPLIFMFKKNFKLRKPLHTYHTRLNHYFKTKAPRIKVKKLDYLDPKDQAKFPTLALYSLPYRYRRPSKIASWYCPYNWVLLPGFRKALAPPLFDIKFYKVKQEEEPTYNLPWPLEDKINIIRKHTHIIFIFSFSLI